MTDTIHLAKAATGGIKLAMPTDSELGEDSWSKDPLSTLAAVSWALASQHGIRVQAAAPGEGPRCDIGNKTLWVPIPPTGSPLWGTMMAAVLHECEHILSTKILPESDLKNFHQLNILEDARINQNIFARWPRARTLMDQGMAAGFVALVQADTPYTPSPTPFSDGVNLTLENVWERGWDKAWLDHGVEAFQDPATLRDMWDEVTQWAKDNKHVVTTASHTSELVSRAKQLADLDEKWRKKLKIPEKQQPQNQQGRGQDDGGNKGEPEAGGGVPQMSKVYQSSDGDREQAEEFNTAQNGRQGCEGGWQLHDRSHLPKRPQNPPRRQALSSGIGGLAGAARQALMSRARTEWEHDRMTGRLDSRKLPGLALGVANAKVFRTRTDVRDVNTAVSVLLDISGSMDGNVGDGTRLDYCTAAAGTVADMVAATPNTQLAVYAYHQHGFVVKQFSEIWSGEPKSALYAAEACGGTDTSNMLMHAVMRSLGLGTKVRRHLVIVMTDGCSGSPDVVRNIVASAPKHGIEVYGVGVDCDVTGEFKGGITLAAENMRTGLLALVRAAMERSVEYTRI
jgi:hypothetical protein